MKKSYEQKLNVMEWARTFLGKSQNSLQSTLIAYDLQSGNYVSNAEKNPKYNLAWGKQLAHFINLRLEQGDSILEVGVGEATTLAAIYKQLKFKNIKLYGFDISWSRLFVANNYLKKQNIKANLFVADLFNIPLADNSIDVVYTSHSLEPNGGKEKEALIECLRVAKKELILFEPIYELANKDAKKRMIHHGYVRNLKHTAEKIGAKVEYYKLLEKRANDLNPTGVLILTKIKKNTNKNISKFICPITKTEIKNYKDFYFSNDSGLIYPIINNIPVLCSESAILGSKMKELV
jgi:ubiquinone/menaquinone biosynthesis C-methylase UbiE